MCALRLLITIFGHDRAARRGRLPREGEVAPRLVVGDVKDHDRWTTAASSSPRPGSNRSLPRTGRVLVQSSYEGNELQRGESNLLGDRLTAGCLTIRHRWNEIPARRRRIAEATARGVVMESQRGLALHFVWHRVVKDRCTSCDGQTNPFTRPGIRARSFGGRNRTCTAGVRSQRPAVGPPRIVFLFVDSEGLRAEGATATRRACASAAERVPPWTTTVGRKGLEPSPLRLKAGCSTY